MISINVELARKIDEEFDNNYANFDSNNQFLIKPALLNFVGGNGWKLITTGGLGQIFIFTKPRGILG